MSSITFAFGARLAVTLLLVAGSAPSFAIGQGTVTAGAEPGTSRTSFTVPSGDLNLASQTDRHILERRIISAARDACGYSPALFRQLGSVRDCYADAVADARRQAGMSNKPGARVSGN